MTRTRLLVALAVVATLTSATFAGELDPPAAPAPTMKTLDQIPGSWDRLLPTGGRFGLALGGAAVLDRETGLVWEQSPSSSQFPWKISHFVCNTLRLGGRMGWRLPAIQELASLVDPIQASPALPSGHPFTNVQVDSVYFSATSITDAVAWGVYFANGAAANNADKLVPSFQWCVRGGRGFEVE